jgi:nickel/cobalt exporter
MNPAYGLRPKPNTLLVLTAIMALSLVLPRVAAAHPMGNFSINHYTKIVPGSSVVEIDYIIDMAEIPTFQETQESGLVTKAGDPSLNGYLAHKASLLKSGLTLKVDKQPLPLVIVSAQAIFPPGAGGLPTMKMGFVYSAKLPHGLSSSPLSLNYRDDNFPGRAGWKEIIGRSGPGARLSASTVPVEDRSLELSNYPTDMLHSPPQKLDAAISVISAPSGILTDTSHKGWLTTGTAFSSQGIMLAPNRQGTPRSAFTDLITSKRTDALFLLMAALIAAVLGGLHALEPGHGKTLVAAYLVGSRGTARHAVALGAIVTGSHTVSVYILGVITLYASQWILPEQLYPWFGAISGLLVTGVGLVLFIRRYATIPPDLDPEHIHNAEDHHHDEWDDHHSHAHSHLHNHDSVSHMPHRHTWWGGHKSEHIQHAHAGSAEMAGTANSLQHHGSGKGVSDFNIPDHSPAADVAGPAPAGVSLKSLFALGITGGIVPCPAALVVLLGALAIHRLVFGLFLIVAFSAGLAAALISFGLAFVYARRFIGRFETQSPLVERWLPLASSAVITIIGVALTLSALATAGVIRVA